MHVLGTAGHVDHGKSTLIHALTGIDPDRLAEEKARGLTIDLGFAWLTLPSGREAGIVDVPGHERFVHNMLAGAGSVDATIFVVAANEGWRPQSEEHLQILDLLGARGGVVALTKADTVDAEALRHVREEIAARLAGTTLDGAEIVPVSAKTGAGMEDLRGALEGLLASVPASPDRGRPRLFVDRSFTIRGAGTVVTGTLTGGSLAAGDEVAVLPAGTRARVRGIQTHRRDRTAAQPGSRVALNLAGLERHDIRRGDAVARPSQWRPTDTIDVELRPVRSLAEPLTSRGAYKLYLGAAEIDCRMTLLNAGELAPGSNAVARLRLAEPVVATELDRVVLRDSGRGVTVGGGRVLDAHPPARRESRPALVARLALRAHSEPDALGALIVAERGAVPSADAVALAGVAHPPGTVALRSFVAGAAWLAEAQRRVETILAEHHAREPLAKGMPLDDARKRTGIEDARLFAEIVEATGSVATDGPLLRLSSHAVRLSPEMIAARAKALEDAAGFTPPPLDELRATHGPKLIAALIDAGDVVKIADAMVFTREAIDTAKRAIAEAAESEGALTASRIRELLGTSRKYAIPLLEYLDATGFTRRTGDTRTVRPS